MSRHSSGYHAANETALRYLAMLTAMPVGRWLTVQDIRERLVNRGYREVTLRTIQRDLWKLAGQFGLEEMDVWKRKVWRRTRPLDQVLGREAA